MTGPTGAGHGRIDAVGLVVHDGRTAATTGAAQAAVALSDRGILVVGCAGDGWERMSPWASDRVEVREATTFARNLDIVLVFGGDGTFLRAAYLARDAGVPLLGVNLGRLGFLSEIEAAEVQPALGRIITRDYAVEERMTLHVEIHDADGALAGSSWALNEASVERTVPQRLVVLEVRVSDGVFANVPADAVICATPTGSTAYAFSARGPILSPLVDAILLVPVAPHSLFDRTLVVDPAESLSLRPVDGEKTCVVTLDGREALDVPPGGSVRVSRGHVPVRMARLSPFDFYQRVRDKFHLR